jgi:hypothetical protein
MRPASLPDDEAERLRCTECGRIPHEDENPDDEWRVYSDGVGELHSFCPECAEREFAPDAPASGLVPLVSRRGSD